MDLNKLKLYAANLKKSEKYLVDGKNIVAKVVGVTFGSRQSLLESVSMETPVRLERDRRNQHDFYAVKVMAEIDSVWEHVGFISRHMSKKISKMLDDGIDVKASVHSIVGGQTSEHSGEKLNRGLRISLYR